MPQADYWSRYAMRTLSQDAYWLRPYDSAAMPRGEQVASGFEFGPAVQDGLIWDYRLPLLAWLKCLTARMVVCSALDPDRTGVFRAELRGYVGQLKRIESRIRSGIARAVPIPHPGFPHWLLGPKDVCGAVDMHGGANDFVSGWTPLYPWRDPIDELVVGGERAPSRYDDYVRLQRQATELRFWRLYDAMGLFAFWSMIPDVEVAAAARRPFGSWNEHPAGAILAVEHAWATGGLAGKLKAFERHAAVVAPEEAAAG